MTVHADELIAITRFAAMIDGLGVCLRYLEVVLQQVCLNIVVGCGFQITHRLSDRVSWKSYCNITFFAYENYFQYKWCNNST